MHCALHSSGTTDYGIPSVPSLHTYFDIYTLSSFVGITDGREKPETSILPEYGNKMFCQMAPESAVIQTYEF